MKTLFFNKDKELLLSLLCCFGLESGNTLVYDFCEDTELSEVMKKEIVSELVKYYKQNYAEIDKLKKNILIEFYSFEKEKKG